MPRDHRLDFGIFIAIHREELGLTGTKVGAACGVTQAEYSNWERCKSLPGTESSVRVLAKTLGIDEERLVAIWKDATKDVENKGAAIITRAYNVTSDGGGTSEDPY